jgi:protein-disulfide isomerase
VVKQILFVHPDDVRVVVRYAAFHQGSDEAIRVLEAARKQGKFDEVLTALFDRQEEWAAHGAPKPDMAWQIARDSGLDLSRARSVARAASTDALLSQEAEDIVALKVERTPTFFVNGRPLTQFGPQPLFDAVAAEIQRTKEAGPKAR